MKAEIHETGLLIIEQTKEGSQGDVRRADGGGKHSAADNTEACRLWSAFIPEGRMHAAGLGEGTGQ